MTGNQLGHQKLHQFACRSILRIKSIRGLHGKMERMRPLQQRLMLLRMVRQGSEFMRTKNGFFMREVLSYM